MTASHPTETLRPALGSDRKWGISARSCWTARAAALGREPPSEPGTKRMICTTGGDLWRGAGAVEIQVLAGHQVCMHAPKAKIAIMRDDG